MARTPNPRRITREQQVIAILQRKGHITEATGFAELGRVQVASAIWRLKNLKSHLIPAGKRIRSVEKFDSSNNRYVEWQLVDAPVMAQGYAEALAA